MATSSSYPHSEGSHSLLDVLARGRMPLVGGLRCAAEVSKTLSELHQQGRAHGRVVPASVLMKESGAELLPGRGQLEKGAQEQDVLGFGTLLYELIMGTKPPVDASAGTFRAPGQTSGLAGIRAAAMRLAGKCLGYFPVNLTMQQAATEVRLLWVQARQLEANGAEEPAPMAAPFLVTPAIAKPAVHSKPREKAAATAPRPVPAEPVAKPVLREVVDAEVDFDLGPGEPVVSPGAADFTKAEEPKAGPRVVEDAPPCPKCDGTPVYESRPRTAFERRLASWRIPICRCHRCYHRYIVMWSMRIGKSLPKHMERRFKPKRRA